MASFLRPKECLLDKNCGKLTNSKSRMEALADQFNRLCLLFPQNITSTDSLSLFAKLPKELRLQIWRNTFPPPRTASIRLVNDWEGIHTNTDYFWKNDPDITLSDADIAKHEWYGYHRRHNGKKRRSPETPVALRVCRESRQEALNHYIIYVPDPAVFKSFLKKSFSKRYRRWDARAGVPREMCTNMYNAESRWMPICFAPARDKVVVTGNCIPLLEILISQIVLSDPRLMSKLKRIQLCWKDYHPRSSVYWDWLDNLWMDFDAISDLVHHLPSLETIDFYASKQVLQWNAWDSVPRKFDYKKAELALQEFVKETQATIFGHKLSAMNLVMYSGRMKA